MAEMTAVKFLKEYDRMCGEYKTNGCLGCPLDEISDKSCQEFIRTHPEDAILNIQLWEEEHPVRTMLQEFLEKYQNAPIETDGTPEFCPGSLGYQNDYELCESSDDNKCTKCWNRPLEE